MPRDNDSNEGWRCSVCRAIYDYAKSSRCPYCELAELREQSAREHAAWEAFFTAGVSKVARSSFEGGKFYAVNNRCRRYGNHPVDAVLAVVKAAKQDAGTEPAAATERTTKHG